MEGEIAVLPVCAALIGVALLVLEPIMVDFFWSSNSLPCNAQTALPSPPKFVNKGTQARAIGLKRKFGYPSDFFMNLYLRFRDFRQLCLERNESPDSVQNVYYLAQQSGFCMKHIVEFEHTARAYATRVYTSWNFDSVHLPKVEEPHACARMIFIIAGNAHCKQPVSFLNDLNSFADAHKGLFILYLATEYVQDVGLRFHRMRNVNVCFNIPFDHGEFGINSTCVSPDASDME